MKINSRIISKVLSFAIVFSMMFNTVYANEFIKSTKIPDIMQPNTVIEYISDHEYVVVKQGEDIKLRATNKNLIFKKENIDVDDLKVEEELIARIFKEATQLPAYVIETPQPVKGMVVVYDAEGYIREIRGSGYNPQPQGSRKPIGTYTFGNHNNKITITDSYVLGVGRITTFSDEIGDHDNTLKKGDVATKGEIDNPRWGTNIGVRNTDNDIKHEMVKNDNGDLPDAVLDVWKDGVEFFGLKWNKYLSFNGRYYYEY